MEINNLLGDLRKSREINRKYKNFIQLYEYLILMKYTAKLDAMFAMVSARD